MQSNSWCTFIRVDYSLGPRPTTVIYQIGWLCLDCKLYSSEMTSWELSLLGCQSWAYFTSTPVHSSHLTCFGTSWENKGIELSKDLEVLVGETENVIIKLLCKRSEQIVIDLQGTRKTETLGFLRESQGGSWIL